MINYLPLIGKLFKRERYWLSNKILQRGYLDIAEQILFEVPKKRYMLYLRNRIHSMQTIRKKGLVLNKIDKQPIDTISILFAVHNSFPYDKNGYAIRTHSIVTHLKEKGLPLIVATRPGYPWDLKKHKHFKTKDQKDIIGSIPHIRLKDEDKTFKKGGDYKYIKVYSNDLCEIAKKYNVTIMHSHSNYLNGLGAIKAANVLQIPSIYEIRGLWHVTRLTLDANYKNSGLFDYEEKMEKAAALHSDTVITISQALKRHIVTWGVEPSKIHVIPNAVDTTLFQPLPKNQRLLAKYKLQNKTVIGFVGSLTGYEGLEQLILAVNDLINEGIDITLMIVGDGKHKSHLENLTKSKNIIFTGRVPFEEVKEYYSLFDICPFPRNDFEVCQYVPPLKILEAMAMQKAIIVSDVAPLLEIIENNVNGLVCKANDINSLKTVIKKLYADKKLRESLAHNAYNWVVKNRSWDSVIHKYMKLYNSFKEK